MRARDWKTKAGYTYGLHGTPTTFTLEERLATLEGGNECLLVPSGLAAIALVSFALLQDRRRGADPRQRLRPQQGAGRRRAGQLRHHAPALRRHEPGRPRGQALGSHQAGVAGSGRLGHDGIPGPAGAGGRSAARAACSRRWTTPGAPASPSAPSISNGSGQGVDISVQALTKYPSGGGDVLMGSVVTRDERLHRALKLTHMRMGFGIGVGDVEALLRSLPSIALRYEAHDRSARELAHWLADRGRDRAGAASGAGRLAGPRELAAAVRRHRPGGRPVLGGVRRALQRRRRSTASATA